MECIYCTPEWLEESAKIYKATPRFQENLKRLSVRVFFRINAEPEWEINEDFIFGALVTAGELNELRFFSEEQAMENADFIMAASPQEWKLILRKEHKFLTDFLLGKIALEKGSKVGVLGLAPYADMFIEALTQVDLKFQDEMSTQELQEYRDYASQFRTEMKI